MLLLLIYTYFCRRFLILLAHTAFSFGVVASLKTSQYLGCCENSVTARANWWSVFGFPPPFDVDTFAPGLGNRPCLIVASSVIAEMSDHVRSASFQLFPIISKCFLDREYIHVLNLDLFTLFFLRRSIQITLIVEG